MLADQPGLMLLLAVTALVVWSAVVGERLRPAVLARVAGWARADRLQVATVRVGAVQLAGLMAMSSWCLVAWLLGGATGWSALTQGMVAVAGVVLGPLWWAQGRVAPGGEPTRTVLERNGIPPDHAPTVAGVCGWSSLAGALGLLSIGAPSLWL